MRFLYKIHSGYDGFRPAVLPERMREGRLRLRWRHYIDVVELGWECWVYFHGPHKFKNGVYAKGIVDKVDLDAHEVRLRLSKYSTASPITRRETSKKVAEVISQRYRQVFAWPDEWTTAPVCSLAECSKGHCPACTTWMGLPLIEKDHAKPPPRLRSHLYKDIVPAHWIVPKRCYETQIIPEVREVTRRFTDFKLGEMTYAYPFALSMHEQLDRRKLLDYDYVVPIPLSPDKAERGESHRTLALAKELGKLLDVRTCEMLELTQAVSKRRMTAYTPKRFEKSYAQSLRALVVPDAERILLVDDVMTRGSTVAMALDAIHNEYREITVVVATAGQMIVKGAVDEDSGFKVESEGGARE